MSIVKTFTSLGATIDQAIGLKVEFVEHVLLEHFNTAKDFDLLGAIVGFTPKENRAGICNNCVTYIREDLSSKEMMKMLENAALYLEEIVKRQNSLD